MLFDYLMKSEVMLKGMIGLEIHTYLVTKEKLEKLKKYIDEIRFHPDFLSTEKQEDYNRDIETIKEASGIFGKKNTGIEVPMFPDKKEETFEFIKKIEAVSILRFLST